MSDDYLLEIEFEYSGDNNQFQNTKGTKTIRLLRKKKNNMKINSNTLIGQNKDRALYRSHTKLRALTLMICLQMNKAKDKDKIYCFNL